MNRLFDIGVIRALTPGKIWNIIKIQTSFQLSKKINRSIVWGDPYILSVEPTNICNLNCPQCITGSGKLNRKKGKMSLEAYMDVIDDLQHSLCYLLLYNQGEPFLHDDLIKFIQYAKLKNIYVITSTNGHFLYDEDKALEIVTSRLDAIIISVDGIDEQTYSLYRKNGNLKKVIDGIQKLVHIRKLCGVRHPKIFIQFLLMKHNIHQIDAVKKLGIDLKVDRVIFKTVQVENSTEALKFLPDDAQWRRYKSGRNRLELAVKTPSCLRLWTSSTILYDGSVVPCCFDKHGRYTFGAINNSPNFQQIWLSEKYEEFRNRIIRQQRSIDICRNCTEGQKTYI